MSIIDRLRTRFSSDRRSFDKWIIRSDYIGQLDKYCTEKPIIDKKQAYLALSDYVISLSGTDKKMKKLYDNLQVLIKDDIIAETVPKKITINTKIKVNDISKKTSSDVSITSTNEIILEISDDGDSRLKNASKSIIIQFIKTAHGFLYDAEMITDLVALNDIMNLLFLKAIAPILSIEPLSGHIDLLNKEYYRDMYGDDDEIIDDILSYIIDINKITTKSLSTIRSNTSEMDIIKQIGTILTMHPVTSKIFTQINILNTTKATAVIKIIKEINKLNIDYLYYNEDTIGEIYEYMINGYLRTGSKLGQFFTPRHMMKMLLTYKKDKFEEIIRYNDSADEKTKVLDTCMGTGGWLVTFYNMYKDICPNRLLLSGNDVENTTFQYGIMNLILTLRHFPHNMSCANSLTHINQEKHHIIITNPPFKTSKNFKDIIDNFAEDKYTKENGINIDEIYKIKSNNSPAQFMELNSYKLCPGGISIIILPYGELFSGKTHRNFRESFMNIYNITDIIVFPEGVFTHTGIKTAAFIYEKTGRTKEINFIESNKECTVLTKILNVSYETINANTVKSWYYPHYTKSMLCNIIKENIIMRNLYEIVTFKNGKGLKKSDIIFGEFPVIGGGKTPMGFHTSFNRSENIILCSSSGASAGYISKYECKVWASDCFSIEPNTDFIFNSYLYYLLSYKFQEEIYNMQIGAAQPHIYSHQIADIIIPVPSIEKQIKIIAYLDHITDNIIKLSNNYIEHIITQNKYYLDNMLELYQDDIVPFESLCDLIKGRLQSTKVINDVDGEICFITKSKLTTYKIRKINSKDYYTEGLFIARAFNGNGKCPIRYYDYKCIHSDLMYYIAIKAENTLLINVKYIYYYLLNMQSIIEEKYQKGSCNKVLDVELFNKMPFILPSLDIQNEIVSYLDFNNDLIAIHNDVITRNEIVIQKYLNSIV